MSNNIVGGIHLEEEGLTDKELVEKATDLMHWKEYKFIGQGNAIFEGCLTQESEEQIAKALIPIIKQVVEEDTNQAWTKILEAEREQKQMCIDNLELQLQALEEEYKEVTKERLDRPALREKIAKQLYYYDNPHGLIWNHYRLAPAIQQTYRNRATRLLALMPDEKEIRRAEREEIKRELERNGLAPSEHFKLTAFLADRKQDYCSPDCKLCAWHAFWEARGVK